MGARRALPGGGTVTTEAYPIGAPVATAVVLRTFGEQVETTTSRMENAFIESARELLETLRDGPLLETAHGAAVLGAAPRRRRRAARQPARDRHLRVAQRREHHAQRRRREPRHRHARLGAPGRRLRHLAPLLGASGALAAELEVTGHILSYRSLALATSVLVLVEDLTEARRRERELTVKEATIREVHHRVKNNLQTIASLLRMQARRSDDEEVRRALGEATARAASMATVHDLLAHSEEECVDFVAVARRVVELVRSGVVGDDPGVTVHVSGSTGAIDAGTATSLALVLTELVHNSLEHAFDPGAAGTVHVDVRRAGEALKLVVRDDGRGLAPDVDPADSRGLGLSIVRTLVEEDLRGTLTTTQEGGTASPSVCRSSRRRTDDDEGARDPRCAY